ncbi:MAG: biotin transporter BioY [Anaerotignaceae bacterium]
MTTKDYLHCGMFAAIICVCAFITIPLFFSPIPFTLQIMGIMTAAAVLGGKKGGIAIGVYILLGCIGLPVFSGFKSGIGALFGATGGFIWGFLPGGIVGGLLCQKFSSNKYLRFVGLLVGLLVIYAIGTVHLMMVANLSLASALLSAVAPFIIFDIVKIVFATIISSRVSFLEKGNRAYYNV